VYEEKLQPRLSKTKKYSVVIHLKHQIIQYQNY